jgi:hypothetical protein
MFYFHSLVRSKDTGGLICNIVYLDPFAFNFVSGHFWVAAVAVHSFACP